MPNLKYRTAKYCLSQIAKVGILHRKACVLANMYLDIDKGFRFSYMPYENGEAEFLNTLSEYFTGKQFLFFDVGAHFGKYTDEILLRFDDYKGHLFEPTPSTYSVCKERLSSNENLIFNNAALSDEAGIVEYRVYPDDPSRNGIAGVSTEVNFTSQTVEVECLTGDEYCKKHSVEYIHFLKIDAEGYDLNVLKGFSKMLDAKKIGAIQFEYNVKHSERHIVMKDFYAFLDSKGYCTGPLRQGGVDFKEFDFFMNDYKLGPNYIACAPELRKALSSFSKR